MKKTVLLFIIFLFVSFLVFGYSKPKHYDVVTLQGLINVYGNEPFTYIGIVTDDGKQYTIKADEKTKKQLRKTQGKKIEIKGEIDEDKESTFNRLKDGYFIVIEWKEIN